MANSQPSDPAEEYDTWYDRFGGEEFFTTLVAGFYARIATDPLLRPMYPEQDLGPAERRLRMFLMQYWGGPKTYGEERGHPRLRMRHAPFPVDEAARDRWLELMGASLAELDLDEVAPAELWAYLTSAAAAMVNQTPAWQ
jgi:hemoglobin